MNEFIYILTNPAMPDWIKVGKTKNIKNRIKQLSEKTGVPLPFECYAFMEVPSDLVFVAENTLHDFLGISHNQEKEFFMMKAETAYKYFQKLAPLNPLFKLSEITPLIETLAEKKKQDKTTFKMLSIPVGSELIYSGDASKTCTVFNDDNQVLYNGVQYSVSGLAMELAKGKGKINGFTKFMFENETLWQRRLRLQNKKK